MTLENLSKQCRFTTTRASGPGGQHVNKTDSAVIILHIPTGIQFKVSESRSQYQNKQLALERLQVILNRRKLTEQRDRELLRFKNKPKKRPRKVKEKILKTKKLNSLKKRSRREAHEE